MQVLQNKIALVTGAASGIGRAIALRLAEEGVHLYLLDINPGQLAETVYRRHANGESSRWDVQCDVSQVP